MEKEHGPGLKMYFLLNMGIFQPAMLVYQSRYVSFGWYLMGLERMTYKLFFFSMQFFPCLFVSSWCCFFSWTRDLYRLGLFDLPSLESSERASLKTLDHWISGVQNLRIFGTLTCLTFISFAMYDTRYQIINHSDTNDLQWEWRIPSWELTYPLPTHFWSSLVGHVGSLEDTSRYSSKIQFCRTIPLAFSSENF